MNFTRTKQTKKIRKEEKSSRTKTLFPFPSSLALLLIAICSLFIVTTCDLLLTNPEGDIMQDIIDEIEYANAPYVNVSIGIIPGSLSASPTENPREKVGYKFTITAAANASYGFAGWRILNLEDWNSLELQDPNFELVFDSKSSFTKVEFEIDDTGKKTRRISTNTLGEVIDLLNAEEMPSGIAEIKVFTANPLVIVPYATMRPAISNATYPAQNARDIGYTNSVEIHFTSPVALDSFVWQPNETPSFVGDIKNVTITGIYGQNEQYDSEVIESFFEAQTDTEGKLLKLQIKEDKIPLTFDIDHFNGMRITIELDNNIEARDAEGVKIMPWQELSFSTTTDTSTVNTRLASLEITIDGTIYSYSTNELARQLEFTRNVNARTQFTIKANAVEYNEVSVTATINEEQLNLDINGRSASTPLEPGRTTITITTRQNIGGASNTYRVYINNFPAEGAPTVSISDALPPVISWNNINGASGYWVYYNNIGGESGRNSAQRLPNIIPRTSNLDITTTITNIAPGTNLYVWVQPVAGSGTTLLESSDWGTNNKLLPGNNNTLKSLSFGTAYQLSPSFYSSAFEYQVIQDIPNNLSSLDVTIARGDEDQTVKWKMNSGTEYTLLKGINTFSASGITTVGQNILYITVIPADTNTLPETYRIYLFKKPAIPTTATTPYTATTEGSITVNWTYTWSSYSTTGTRGFEVASSTSNTPGVPITAAQGDRSKLITGLIVNNLYNVWVRAYITEGGRVIYSEWNPHVTLSTYNTLDILRISNNSSTLNASSNLSGNMVNSYELDDNNINTFYVGFTATGGTAAEVEFIPDEDDVIRFTGTGNTRTANVNWSRGSVNDSESIFIIRVKAQHRSYYQDYTVVVKRTIPVSLVVTPPSTTVFPVSNDYTTTPINANNALSGLRPILVEMINSAGSRRTIPLNEVTLEYNLRTAGPSLVTVRAEGAVATFPITAVGLVDLSILGRSIPFNSYTTNYDLGILPNSNDKMTIFASSAGGNAPEFSTGFAHNTEGNVNIGQNTVTITVRNDNGTTTINDDVTKTYTITMRRRPVDVSGITSYKSGNLSAILSWPSAEGAGYYDIYYNTTGTNPTEATTPTISNINTNSCTITGLTEGQTYYIWVRSKSSDQTTVSTYWTQRVPVLVGVPFSSTMLTTGSTTRHIIGEEDSPHLISNTTISGNRTLIAATGATVVIKRNIATDPLITISSSNSLTLNSGSANEGIIIIDGGATFTDNGSGFVELVDFDGMTSNNSLIWLSGGNLEINRNVCNRQFYHFLR